MYKRQKVDTAECRKNPGKVWVDVAKMLEKERRQGDCIFARFGNIAFVQLRDLKVVTFLTGIHMGTGCGK